jgi:hypothetical protein
VALSGNKRGEIPSPMAAPPCAGKLHVFRVRVVCLIK